MCALGAPRLFTISPDYLVLIRRGQNQASFDQYFAYCAVRAPFSAQWAARNTPPPVPIAVAAFFAAALPAKMASTRPIQPLGPLNRSHSAPHCAFWRETTVTDR